MLHYVQCGMILIPMDRFFGWWKSLQSPEQSSTLLEYFKNLAARTSHPLKTDSIDYLVVLSGEMYMEMEDGQTLLSQGDCIVQRGTNHAWVNKSEKPCLIAAVLIDANKAP